MLARTTITTWVMAATIAAFYKALPRSKIRTSVVPLLPSRMLEVVIQAALLYMIVASGWRSQWFTFALSVAFFAEHLSQLTLCYRSQTILQHGSVLALEAMAIHSAYSERSYDVCALMSVGAALHLVSALRGGTSMLAPVCLTNRS